MTSSIPPVRDSDRPCTSAVFHIPFIKALPEHYKLTTIFERSATETQSKARDAFPDVRVVNTLQQVLEDSSIQLVFVSTINDTHYDYTKAALNAGKHVVVEKPVTPTSEQAYELAALAKEKNLVLAVYQNRRWDSDFLTVKKLIEAGKFGELSEFQSNFDRFKMESAIAAGTAKKWKEEDRPGSGSHFDLGSHLVSSQLNIGCMRPQLMPRHASRLTRFWICSASLRQSPPCCATPEVSVCPTCPTASSFTVRRLISVPSCVIDFDLATCLHSAL